MNFVIIQLNEMKQITYIQSNVPVKRKLVVYVTLINAVQN